MDYIALGCMSGTSLDGIDLSLIRSDGETYTDEILNYFQPYSKELRRKLNSIIQKGVNVGDKAIIGAMSFVNKDVPPFGKYYGNKIKYQ